MISIRVNGTPHQLDVEPETPLLWVLRDEVGLTGTKFGCGIAQCGACTVHVDGKADALLLGAGRRARRREDHHHRGPVARQQASGAAGLARRGRAAMRLLPVRADHGDGGASCKAIPNPTDADIDANITNICRCGTYERLRRAIHRAAALMRT